MTKKQSSLDAFFSGKKKPTKKEEEATKPTTPDKASENTKAVKTEGKKSKTRFDGEKTKAKTTDSDKSITTTKKKAPSQKQQREPLKREAFDEDEEEDELIAAAIEDDEEDIIFEGAPVELCPQDTPPCCLLHSVYDGKSGKGFLFLLDEHSNRLYGWYDNTNHEPYLLTDLSEKQLKTIPAVKNYRKITGYKEVQKVNLLLDETVNMTKITVTDPLAIGGRTDSLREKIPDAWEAKIRYHHNYLYDRNLVPGMYYKITNGNLVEVKPSYDKEVEEEIIELFKSEHEEMRKLIPRYLPLFLTRMPYIKRAAIDIEVYTKDMNHIADPNKALEKVISVAIVGNDGRKVVLVLEREDVPKGTRLKDLTDDIEVVFFKKEDKLLRETFKIMSEYPMIITFNGDNFDLPYLYHRAARMKINRKDNPIIIGRTQCMIRNAIHFDLYRFFNQAAIKIYAFGAKYSESSLDAISSALLEENKIELEKEIGFLNWYELAWYNFWDSKITLELTTFDDEITIKLVLLLMRLTRMPFEDITRQAVSSWIRNWLFAEHRIRNYLIPNPEEIRTSRGDSTTNAMIKGKKYKGALVVKPHPGIHFDVTVLDFASLYPSIIKTWNLSYETMNCKHESCQKNKTTIPDTDHWVCNKKRGLMSVLIGFIRDIRVNWFKPRRKDRSLDQVTRNSYDVIQAALKVVINASYGVFGAPHFPLYCPPLAEATTAIGRQAIKDTIKKCEEMAVPVIYGDTDSVFLKKPTREQIKKLIDWSNKNLRIDLDVEKSYRYLALSKRKKNYFGVYPDGKMDIKGLMGKKRNTPPFLKKVFNDILKKLSAVQKPEDFSTAKDEIETIVQKCYSSLKKKQLSVEDLAFKVQLNKELDKYVKTTPQHVKAGRMLADQTGQKVGAGDLISFIKTYTAEGVKPIELADPSEIDVDKYLAQMESTLTQVLEPIGISFDRIIGIRSLDDFFS